MVRIMSLVDSREDRLEDMNLDEGEVTGDVMTRVRGDRSVPRKIRQLRIAEKEQVPDQS